MPELTCQAWQQRPLYWSTIAYLRAWWATDGVRLAVIRKHGMWPEMLRSLGAEYNVNRSIVRTDKAKGIEDTSAKAICDILHRAGDRWPAELLDRAQACEGIAFQMRSYTGETEKNLVSAATKFMWFLKPDGWTVFDSFAAAGMGVKAHLPRLEQLRNFYAQLNAAGFGPLAVEMEVIIRRSTLSGLPAARILDTLLMARGGRSGDAGAVERLEAFLNLLPAASRSPLETLATSLHERFGVHELASPYKPTIPRKKGQKAHPHKIAR